MMTKMINQEEVVKALFTPITASGKLKQLLYPCDAAVIGDIADAINAVSSIAKKDTAMVAQAVISTLAGATQHRYQVRYFDDVGNRPLSLFVLTIAKSARGKSHISKLCSRSLEAIEKAKMRNHQKEMMAYKQALKSKGKESEPLFEPTNPKFIFNSGTIEGMIDVIARNGYCYALIDELAILLGGHSAKPENLGKLIGTLSSVWSDGEYSEVKRGNDDPRQVNGDLTFSANGQPDIVKPMFNSPVWREQGTIPRFLVCEPIHTKHKRIKGETINPKDQQALDGFNDTIRQIFSVAPCVEGKYTVIANEAAEGLMTDFYNEMQDIARLK